MKVGYLITGRLKSKRLPKKLLLEIEGKTYLEHMVDRIRLSKRTDVIVLCTSTNSQDDPLEEFAKNNGIECFRGDEDDVIERLYSASQIHDLDYILNITADCPCVDPLYADKIVEVFEKNGPDLITSFDLPHGAFTYGIKPSALKKAMEIKDSSDTGAWARYFTDTDTFDVYCLPIDNEKHRRPDIRITLDYPADDEFFRELFSALYKQGQVFSLDEIIDFLNAHPEVVAINAHCEELYLAKYTKESEIKLKERFKPEKIVIFGSGSIGQRHIRNLKKMGYVKIAAFRTLQGHYKELPSELEVQELSEWNEIFDFKPDVAIISNPTNLHLEMATRIAPYVKGIFIEKPLSHSVRGVKEFIDLVESKKIISFVGYNLHMHPAVKIIKGEMDKDYLGKPITFKCQYGKWLPDWHPYEEFQKAYSANKDLGGGVTLTLIHEINLAHTLFGPVEKVSAFFTQSEELVLDVDVVSDMTIYHKNGVVSQIHLDFIQRPASRSGSILFEQGWLSYDLINSNVMVQAKSEKAPKVLWDEGDYDIDEMYQDELKNFLRYVSEGRMRHDFDVWHASEDMELVEAVFESDRTGRIINIGDK